jgi:thiamine kinase-like enzyme
MSAIPERPEQITPAWISQAFASRHPGAEAVSVAVVDAHSGTTGRARLRVAWKPPADAPTAVFAKLAPTDPIQREMVISTGMGKREARFYAELASDVPVRVPKPYGSRWNEAGSAYLMLMEDVGASGCRFPTWKDPAVPRYASGMMESLAQLHAHFQQSPRFDRDLAWIEPPMRSTIGPLLTKAALEAFGDDMPASFHEMARIYIDHTQAFCDRLDAGSPTLIHGDAHLGNLLLEDGRIGLLDWACLAKAPGMRDVAYFLSNSISTELRRSQERELVGVYLESLERAGGMAPRFEEAWRQYRLYAACGWIAATVTAAAGSRMQSLEIGMRSMKRSTEAIIDLETPALLREELGLS